jgi:dTDP-4-dehydrorhamnose 3,5-epimerase
VSIEGVTIAFGKLVTNERGFLREITRDNEPGFFRIGQLYQTCTRPGVVNAWYKHQEQFDGILLLSGTMHMVLCDDRPASPTYRLVQEIQMDELNPGLVRIPPGVWYGFQSLERDLILIHLNSHAQDPSAPDEERISSDSERIPYRWSSIF